MSQGDDRGGANPPAPSEPATNAELDSAANPEPVPDAVPLRPLPLAVLLALIVAMNALGALKGWTLREELMRTIPKLTPAMFGLWALAPPIAIAGAVGLWCLRRWGLYLLGISWALAVIVDVVIGATNHAFLATGVMWLVVMFSRPIRGALR